MNSHNINAAWLEELTADINMEQTLQNFSTQIDSMLTNVASVLSSTVKGLITASFAFIIAVYISLDGKRVGRHATKLITAYLNRHGLNGYYMFAGHFAESLAIF